MCQIIKPSFFKIACYVLLLSTALSCGFKKDKPTSLTAIVNANTIKDIQEKGKLRVAISYSPTVFLCIKVRLWVSIMIWLNGYLKILA